MEHTPIQVAFARCDSTATLNLTINQSDTSFIEVTSCESYEWNGQTYTESGTYEYSEQNNNEFSMSFDGIDDYLSNTTLNPSTNSFSIMIDVMFNDVDNGSSLYEMIAQKWTSSNDGTNGFHLRLDRDLENNGATFPYLRASVGSGNIGAANISTDFEISSNTFYNLCMVINRITNQLEFYVDSELIGSENISQFTDLNNPHPLEIGRHYWSNGDPYNHYFNGAMDNFSYWDYPLNSEQINQYMNCPPTENESGLIALWNFELGNGGTVLDQSGNGNDGTINGATFDTNVPTQSCQLTTVNGCDSVAVLNLTVTEPDTSFTEVIACESYEWNGITYTESGTYTTVLNDLGNSMSFDGIDDNVNFGVIDLNGNNMNISFDVFVNENSFSQGVEIIGQNGFLGEDWFGIRYEQEYNQNDQNNYFSFRRYKEGYAYDVIIPFEMESEVWTNISVNYSLDNQIVNLYIDGEWVGTDNCTLEPFSNSNLEIGGNVADENSSFEGKIDNLTI